MGLYLKQNETRSDLRLRIESELREKQRKKAELDSKLPDGVEDSRYIEKTKITSSLAWVWACIFIAIIAILIWLVALTF